MQLSHRFLNAFLICLERKKNASHILHCIIDQTRCLDVCLLGRYTHSPGPPAGISFSIATGEERPQRMLALEEQLSLPSLWGNVGSSLEI